LVDSESDVSGSDMELSTAAGNIGNLLEFETPTGNHGNLEFF